MILVGYAHSVCGVQCFTFSSSTTHRKGPIQVPKTTNQNFSNNRTLTLPDQSCHLIHDTPMQQRKEKNQVIASRNNSTCSSSQIRWGLSMQHSSFAMSPSELHVEATQQNFQLLLLAGRRQSFIIEATRCQMRIAR